MSTVNATVTDLRCSVVAREHRFRKQKKFGAGETLPEANHASDATRGAARKRIGRRGIRGPGAKNGLFDRWRHLAERCVSRVVEPGSRKQPGVAVSQIDGALRAKRSHPWKARSWRAFSWHLDRFSFACINAEPPPVARDREGFLGFVSASRRPGDEKGSKR